ncbi:hypothetical protein ETD86_50360 [Nonomuraea turkmeniaca]|uniref:Endonuclease/exonuclease/phosphatase family protein n=1 Tax=Nonomuraea turkmeniaca TaxID=103838 RepID=A0A5S4EW86_9ACTN|nr:endonuclease/exonuclease/phosphatase family protein [Nonomuraea turkmeniaca]TMR07823.1 hypothetical protein ETD86_50360 [Nonomuraea turkmeniaca]
MSAHLLTIISQNAAYGADTQGRWPDLVQVIRNQHADVILLQEVDWLADPKVAAQAATDLGMQIVVAPSRNLPTAVAWRPEALELIATETKYSRELHHGYCAPRFRPAGLQVDMPLVVISAHLIPYSAQAAAQEAQMLIARLYRYGGLGLLGGDINHCPVLLDGQPEPDWQAVQPYNRSSRCHRRTTLDEPWRGDQIVGQTLRDGDLIDVAAHVAAEKGDVGLLAPTGRHGGVRVDQLHVSAALTPAITDYWRIDPGTASDHYGVGTRLDLTHLDHARLRAWT